MKFSVFTLVLIALATTLLADGGMTSGSTFKLVNMAAMGQDACTKAGKWLTPEGCKGKKKVSTTKPKYDVDEQRPAVPKLMALNAYVADTAKDAKKKKKKEGKKGEKINIPIFEAVIDSQECRPTKPTATGRPRPTRPFGPKTKVAFYETAGLGCDSKPWICFPDPKPPKKTKVPPKTKAYDDADTAASIETMFAEGEGSKKRTAQKIYGGRTWIGEMNKHLSRRPDDRYDTVSLYGIPVLKKEQKPIDRKTNPYCRDGCGGSVGSWGTPKR
jgi:hypothetical protein